MKNIVLEWVDSVLKEENTCNCIDGRHYNNADETSGQWTPCDKCELGSEVDPGDDIEAALTYYEEK